MIGQKNISALQDLKRLFGFVAQGALGDNGKPNECTSPLDDLMKVVLSCCKILVDAFLELNATIERKAAGEKDVLDRRLELLERSICETGERARALAAELDDVSRHVEHNVVVTASIRQDVEGLQRGIEKHAIFIEGELQQLKEVSAVATEFMTIYGEQDVVGRLRGICELLRIERGSDHVTRSQTIDRFLATLDDQRCIVEELLIAKSTTGAQPVLGFAVKDSPEGTVVSDVFKGFPAEKSGLEVGDRIVALASAAVKKRADVERALEKMANQSDVLIHAVRGGQLIEIRCQRV
jgi:hypothetical protein